MWNTPKSNSVSYITIEKYIRKLLSVATRITTFFIQNNIKDVEFLQKHFIRDKLLSIIATLLSYNLHAHRKPFFTSTLVFLFVKTFEKHRTIHKTSKTISRSMVFRVHKLCSTYPNTISTSSTKISTYQTYLPTWKV